MKHQPPALLSILRSNLQGRILARLLLDPDRAYALRELATSLGASLSSVHAEIERLTAAELVLNRSVGRSSQISANTEHELYPSLFDLILRTYGPREAAERVVSEHAGEGIESAYIFGSWARRYDGELGPLPRDLDLVLIGDVARSTVREIADRLESTLGTEVGVTSFDREQWRSASSGFLQTVKSGPLIDVMGRRSGAVGER